MKTLVKLLAVLFLPCCILILNTNKTFAHTGLQGTNSDNVEVIEILANPTTNDQIGASLRLNVENGIILDFTLDAKYKTSSIPTCPELKLFTSTNICVDILNNPSSQPFVKNDHLATVKVKWDTDSARTIARIDGNGYTNGKSFVAVTDEQVGAKVPDTFSATQVLSTNYLPAIFFAISIVFFIGAAILVYKKNIFSKFTIQKRIALEGSAFVFATLFLMSGVLLQLTDTSDPKLLELPMTGSSSSNFPLARKVKILYFNPKLANGKDLITNQNWNTPASMATSYIDFFKKTTGNRVSYTVSSIQGINDFPILEGGKKYNETSYFNCLNTGSNCYKEPSGALAIQDYKSLINTQNLCQQFNNGEFDELWMFGGPYFGFWEANQAGANAFNTNGPVITGTTCNKPMTIMGFSMERGLAEMIEDFNHRLEGTMNRVYDGQNKQALTTNYDKFIHNFSESGSGFSGCGWAHYTPVSTHDYGWSETGTVQSYCDEFLNYPTINTNNRKPVNCSAWECTSVGYFSWLLTRLPNKDGVGPDGKLNDWWRYVIIPETVYMPIASTVTPTITANPTAPISLSCQQDGKTWCSNHGGVALTVPYDVANWNECLAWCNQNMSTDKPLCQYNADSKRSCWINKAPSGGINNCTWTNGVPPYGACLTTPPVATCSQNGSSWCSNHGGVALTVDHNVANWSECLSWCNQNMNTSRPLCQYNADSPRSCWVNYAPAGGITNCSWKAGTPAPYGYCLGSISATNSPTPKPTLTPTPRPTNTPIPIVTPTIKPTTTPVPQSSFSKEIIDLAKALEPTMLSSSTKKNTTGVCGPMDTYSDQKFDMNDFWNLGDHYLQRCSDNTTSYGKCGGRDANRDGVVNIYDLQAFLFGYDKISCK